MPDVSLNAPERSEMYMFEIEVARFSIFLTSFSVLKSSKILISTPLVEFSIAVDNETVLVEFPTGCRNTSVRLTDATSTVSLKVSTSSLASKSRLKNDKDGGLVSGVKFEATIGVSDPDSGLPAVSSTSPYTGKTLVFPALVARLVEALIAFRSSEVNSISTTPN